MSDLNWMTIETAPKPINQFGNGPDVVFLLPDERQVPGATRLSSDGSVVYLVMEECRCCYYKLPHDETPTHWAYLETTTDSVNA
jgi:hypothetical protein